MSTIKLLSIEVENLRGYFNASLDLTQNKVLIVGPNNSGKTSVIKLINWLFNEVNPEEFRNKKELATKEKTLLLPARKTKHRARRLTFNLQIGDGRSWKKFYCEHTNGVAKLRVNVRLTPSALIYVALAEPTRGEKAKSWDSAIELLTRIQETIDFIYIPSFRDVNSQKFEHSLKDAFQRRIELRALHSERAGAPTEHRQVASSLDNLRQVVLGLASPLWEDMKNQLPPGLVKGASLQLDCDQSELLQFLQNKLKLQVSTGDHDSSFVPLNELGSGLQSLLDLAIQESEVTNSSTKSVVLAVEEPEAFLHPAAQRSVSSRLLKSRTIAQTIITTHSPIVIEEARFGDVAICRGQKFFQSKGVDGIHRDEINTALLSGYGSEMIFARSVLLVEGDGDRQFFEQVRRRLSFIDESGLVDQCFVVPAGGKTRFAPWIRLIRSYGTQGDRPINWFVACDSDASTEIKRALVDSKIKLDGDTSKLLNDISTAMPDVEAWTEAVRIANSHVNKTEYRFNFLSLDLEEAILKSASMSLIQDVATKLGMEGAVSKEALLKKMGAKRYEGNSQTSAKAPWIRGYIGKVISPDEIPLDTQKCVEKWLCGAMDVKDVKALIEKWKSG